MFEERPRELRPFVRELREDELVRALRERDDADLPERDDVLDELRFDLAADREPDLALADRRALPDDERLPRDREARPPLLTAVRRDELLSAAADREATR